MTKMAVMSIYSQKKNKKKKKKKQTLKTFFPGTERSMTLKLNLQH